VRACVWVLVVLGVGLPSAGHADERAAARRFAAALGDEPALVAFLRAFPKGADLHSHLGGAVYAEDLLGHALQRRLHFDPTTNLFAAQPSARTVPAARLLEDHRLRHQFLDAASMRGTRPGPAGGHDHFFASFTPAGSARSGVPPEELLAPVLRRARQQQVQYLEIMAPVGSAALDRVTAAATAGVPPEQLLARLQPLIDAYVTAARAELDRWDAALQHALGLPAPPTTAGGPITVRYLVTAYRVAPPEHVFATFAAAFALMRVDRRVVGANLASPEDHPVALQQFDRHMRDLDLLWRRGGEPNVSLHAGELNLHLAPLEHLTHHIRRSIEVGHARRIGHGTAVGWEDDLPGLLRLMRTRRVAVEVCPSSALTILGLAGERHPFRVYRRAGVPLTLNTDDEGVSRSNLTMEYVHAVRAFRLSYADLKELSRNGLEHSFLPGASLFVGGDYRRVWPELAKLRARGWQPTPAEQRALGRSERATVQARLERALWEFERQ
jgi:adenosine deaminase